MGQEGCRLWIDEMGLDMVRFGVIDFRWMRIGIGRTLE